MLTNKKVSVIVPCYNDEGNIKALIERLIKCLVDITPNWEIIYINDASPDNAQQLLDKFAGDDKRIKVIKFSRNFGVMSAFRAGIDYSTGDAIVIMDGDLQDPPEIISQFVEKWNDGFYVVYGCRKTRDETLIRRIGYKMFYPIWRWLSDFDIPIGAGEFALIDRRVADIIININEQELFLRGIRSWIGFPQTGINYHRPDRHSGNTTQTMLSYLNWATKAITSFSIVPLRFISLLVLLSFVVICILILMKVGVILKGVEAPPGFFTILFAIMGIGAVQLLSLSIIAEYIIHIFKEVKQRPKYIIEKTINFDEE